MKLNQLTIILAAIFGGLLMVACGQSNQTSNQNISNQTASGQTTSPQIKEIKLSSDLLSPDAGESDINDDLSKDRSAIKALQGNDENLRQKTLDEVLNQPNDYAPVVLCNVSLNLFEQGKRDEAAFWFYTCQLRVRIDVNLSTDPSTTATADKIGGIFGPKINKYAFEDMDKLEKTVNKVVEFVRNNQENYDRNWINFTGLAAIQAAMKKEELGNHLKPKNEWAAIKKETIDNYYKGFLEAKKKMEAQKSSS